MVYDKGWNVGGSKGTRLLRCHYHIYLLFLLAVGLSKMQSLRITLVRQVASVDLSIRPVSYGIFLSGSDHLRETESPRLRSRDKDPQNPKDLEVGVTKSPVSVEHKLEPDQVQLPQCLPSMEGNGC